MTKQHVTLHKIVVVVAAVLVALGLSSVGLLPRLQATTVVPLSFDELVNQSEMIVLGRCIASRAEWDARTKGIWTHTTIQITQVYKGPLSGRATVVVSEPGGIVGGQGEYVSGAPQFALDEEIMLFLYRTPVGFLRVRGWGQGKFIVQEDSVSKEKYVTPSLESSLEELPVGEAVGKTAQRQPLISAGRAGKVPLLVFIRKIQDTLAKTNKEGKR